MNASSSGTIRATSTGEDETTNKKLKQDSDQPCCITQDDQSSLHSTGGESDSHVGAGDAPVSHDAADQSNIDAAMMLKTTCSALMNQLGNEVKMVHEAFTPVIRDCENAEEVCLNQLEGLLKQAKDYEQSLLAQKEQLGGRLKMLSHTLKIL